MADRGRRVFAVNRRQVLRHLAGGAAVFGGSVLAQRALGQTSQDAALRALIRHNQQSDFGQDFDSSSRTILMPKSSLPTLSGATAQTTEQAIATYEAIRARGGWPQVPPIEKLRLGNRHAAVEALRRRLAASGDLDAAAGGGDIYDSYVDAALRRFQARHGITVDGIVDGPTLKALNVPLDVRLAQLKMNVGRLTALSGDLGPQYVVCNIPAAQIEAIENGVCVSRHIAVVGKPTGPRRRSRAASPRSISIRTGLCRSRSCGAISFPRCRPSPTISPRTTSASSTAGAASCSRPTSTGRPTRRCTTRSSRTPGS
jgi:peptidoglycan hydrolase-like protein with peptidoglycan-binding domain